MVCSSFKDPLRSSNKISSPPGKFGRLMDERTHSQTEQPGESKLAKNTVKIGLCIVFYLEKVKNPFSSGRDNKKKRKAGSERRKRRIAASWITSLNQGGSNFVPRS